jgi:hypothetical protein
MAATFTRTQDSHVIEYECHGCGALMRFTLSTPEVTVIKVIEEHGAVCKDFKIQVGELVPVGRYA